MCSGLEPARVRTGSFSNQDWRERGGGGGASCPQNCSRYTSEHSPSQTSTEMQQKGPRDTVDLGTNSPALCMRFRERSANARLSLAPGKPLSVFRSPWSRDRALSQTEARGRLLERRHPGEA